MQFEVGKRYKTPGSYMQIVKRTEKSIWYIEPSWTDFLRSMTNKEISDKVRMARINTIDGEESFQIGIMSYCYAKNVME